MRSFLTEKKLVVILFVLVLITFALAQEDSRKMAKLQPGLMIQTSDWRPKAQRNLTGKSEGKNSQTTVVTPSITE